MSQKHYTIGIDIGGTDMKAVLFNGAKVILSYSLATPKDNLEHFMIMLKALMEPLFEKAQTDKIKIKGIGIGVAGIQDYEKGIIIKSPNISILDGVNLVEQLEKNIKIPIKTDNDTDCFLRAEMKMGAGEKYNNALGITLGTGIGGAWWINNQIYTGVDGSAGEIGHVIINYENQTTLEKAYQKLTQNNPANLANEAYHGDILAEKVFEELGQDLGITLANAVNLINPEVIIIGGSATKSGDLFFSQIKKSMREHIMNPEAKKIKILKSKLENNAGSIGAALLME